MEKREIHGDSQNLRPTQCVWLVVDGCVCAESMQTKFQSNI